MHGAIDLETGKTRMLDVPAVDAASTIVLLASIAEMYPALRLIHVFLDNARYQHAKLVRQWLARVPDQAPLYSGLLHASGLDRTIRGLMHRHVTHNTRYATFNDLRIAVLDFLRYDMPRNWRIYCNQVTDNFRIIDPKGFRGSRVSRVYRAPIR